MLNFNCTQAEIRDWKVKGLRHFRGIILAGGKSEEFKEAWKFAAQKGRSIVQEAE